MTFTLSTFTESRGWLWLHGRDGLGRRRTFVVAAVQRRFWLIVFMERIDVTLVDDRLQPFPAPAGHLNESNAGAGVPAFSTIQTKPMQ